MTLIDPPVLYLGRRGLGRIARGRILVPVPFGDPFAFLQRSIVGGTPVERYNRLWRMGPRRIESYGINGRIGFERQVGSTEAWDEQQGDFVRVARVEGQTSRYVISREHVGEPNVFPIAFQIRGSLIKRQSFVQAFQALLEEGSQVAGWKVEAEDTEMTFADWVGTVERVQEMTIRLERPNPNYAKRPQIKKIVGDTNAELARLVLQAPEGEGLDVDDDFITQAIDHAVEHGYGWVRASGPEQGGQGAKATFDTRRDQTTTEARAPVDETGEVPPRFLREAAEAVRASRRRFFR